MGRTKIHIISALFVVVHTAVVFAATAPNGDIEAKRASYREAMRAIKSGNDNKYRELEASLNGYILQSHAQYTYYRRNISRISPKTLRAFLEQNKHTYTADRLRERWLVHLAKSRGWNQFMAEYRPHLRDKALRCHWLARKLKEEGADQRALMQSIESMWLSAKRLPSACNNVFALWRDAGHMSRELVYARIKLAMERRKITLARELGRYLGARDRDWIERWVRVHRRPARELAHVNWPLDTPVARMIIRHGIVRLSYRDPEEAMRLWGEFKLKQQFFGEDDNYVLRRVGIVAAKMHLPQAVTWLSAVSASEDDSDLRHWRIRAALRVKNWKLANHFISALSQDEQDEDEWRYWRARIDEQSGRTQEAWTRYSELAQERSYYGFLAADIIGAPYSMQHRSVAIQPDEMARMSARRDVAYAEELYRVGQVVDARRQWRWATMHMNNRELQAAAAFARSLGWYDRAVLTVARSGHYDDLELRFPVIYREQIETNAQRNDIDVGWVYGVVRQESAFMSDARSSAGALGLMQLMPRTGRETARRMRLRIRSRSAIMEIDNNIRLGTYYLRTVLARHDGNQALATAAYNAGSHRVIRWLPDDKNLSPDIWVDSIPFDETRGYVKNVMAFAAIYEHRLGLARTLLRERMLTVMPAKSSQ